MVHMGEMKKPFKTAVRRLGTDGRVILSGSRRKGVGMCGQGRDK
jgi:hypothetical protein